MNREIKFRAWNFVAKKMYYPENTGNIFLWQKEGQVQEIMQFTGLLDKNGKEIYEGDIITCVTNGHMEWPHQGIVEYLGQSNDYYCGYFGINVGVNLNGKFEFTHFWNNKGFEVIGNIYENVELIIE